MKNNEKKLNDEFIKQLSDMKETPQLSEEKKKELWQKILIRSEKEAAIKPDKGYYNYMTKAAGIIAVISAVFFVFNEITKEKEIILSYIRGSEKKEINLNKEVYNSNRSFFEGTIDNHIRVWSGNIQDLTANIEDKNLVLTFKRFLPVSTGNRSDPGCSDPGELQSF